MRSLFRASLGLVFMMLVGCDSCNTVVTPPTGDMTPTDMTSDQGDVSPDADLPKICTPGEISGCRQENTPAVDRCNNDGTAFEPSSCPGVQVCREDACVPVECIPGSKRCMGAGFDAQPQQCNDAGEAFEDIAACEPGFLCEEGVCLNRCEIAERTGSYIGCEYWSVELENHLLYSDPNSPGVNLSAEEMPPFAIVLANTSETYDAQVSIFEDEGVPAQAIRERLARDKSPQPGVDFVTVYSELVDAQGQRVRQIEGPVDKLELPRGHLMTIILPHKRMPFGASSLTKSAYKVVSSQPVVAYQFNPLCCNYNTTNDASLLLPKGALTENYMFMSYAVFAGTGQGRLTNPFSPTLTVLATEPDTQVTVNLRPSKLEGRPYRELLYPSNDPRLPGPTDQGVITVTLQPYEVLNLGGTGKAPVEDLTGAKITASKPVAVFGGHTCAYVPFTKGFCDHLESQLFPVETWGQRFALSPLKLRADPPEPISREATYWKFLAREDQTRIETGIDLSHGPQGTLRPADEGVPSCVDFSDDPTTGIFTLDSGQTCEFGTRTMFIAQADKPMMVGAFISGQDTVMEDAFFGDYAGDPAFFLIPPEEQYRTSYAFLTPATYFFSYVTVTTIPGTLVTLDGVELNLMEFDYEQEPISGTIRAHIPVEPGPHNISAQTPFGIIVYGYDDYVSYAYTGGQNLTKLSP